MTDAVLVERRDGIQIITINRPEARNAEAAHGIADAVDELDRDDDLRVGVLTGAGGTFCAGMDLKEYLCGESPAIEGRGLAGITTTPPRKPLIAAVEGWALAGGFEMLFACDMAVAAQTSKFGVPDADPDHMSGTLLHKRYIDALGTIEVLCSKGGDGAGHRRTTAVDSGCQAPGVVGLIGLPCD